MRFNDTCQSVIKEGGCVKVTTYFRAILSNEASHNCTFPMRHDAMLLLLEIIPVLLVSREGSDGFSIALLTLGMLVLAGTTEVI